MFFLRRIFGPAVDFRAIEKTGAIILDVRTAGEFMAGHIPGSVNLPVHQVESAVAELGKSGKPIITCCRTGLRSGQAAQLLRKLGLEAYNGGSWSKLIKQIDR